MATTTRETYYLKDGLTTRPTAQIEVLNPQLHVVGISNPMGPGDVEISEAQYDTYVALIEQQASQAMKDAVANYHAGIAADKSSAVSKLQGLGLTADEISALMYS